MTTKSIPSIMRKYLDHPECKHERNDVEKVNIFYCNNNFNYTSLQKFSIVLNGTAYQIPYDDLYTTVEGKLLCKVFVSENNNKWVLGQAFMRSLHVMFDNEESKIGFYGKNEFRQDVSLYTTDNDPDTSHHIFLIILTMAGVVGIVAVVSYFVISKKNRRKKRRYKLFRDPKGNVAIADKQDNLVAITDDAESVNYWLNKKEKTKSVENVDSNKN